MFARLFVGVVVLGVAFGTCALTAQSPTHQVVVTDPAGAATTRDAFPGYGVWFRDDVRTGSAVGITTDYARSGTGSMLLVGATSAAKANVAYYFAPSDYSFTSLGNFAGIGYDYFRDGLSTVAAHLAPAIRFLVDADGDMATTGDRGSLVYEPVYNGVAAAPVDQWVSSFVGPTTALWFNQTGRGVEEVFSRTLADYQAGSYTSRPGFAHVTGSSLVYGVSVGIGSGWSGTYTGAVDNVTIALRASPTGPLTTTYDFEPGAPATTTPEPVTIALVGSGLLVLGGIARRRRR